MHTLGQFRVTGEPMDHVFGRKRECPEETHTCTRTCRTQWGFGPGPRVLTTVRVSLNQKQVKSQSEAWTFVCSLSIQWSFFEDRLITSAFMSGQSRSLLHTVVIFCWRSEHFDFSVQKEVCRNRDGVRKDPGKTRSCWNRSSTGMDWRGWYPVGWSPWQQ